MSLGMEVKVCNTCEKPKATLTCGICECSLCKYCAQILAHDQFSFLPVIPVVLSHQVYCGVCFDREVASEVQNYEQTMEEAKNIHIFFKAQGKETRLIKRNEKPIKISDCADRDEAILRLAFVAAQGKFNSVLDVDVVSKKIRMGAYQTQTYSVTGMPAQVDSRKLLKDRALWDSPN
ncbi:MAG: hypothetical protein AB7O96_18175 [Pseudobdellovibrionaceae bacterium]